MSLLRKNVASQNIYFALINATTGAALTGASVTTWVSKDGAAQASGSGTVTGDGNGQYHYAPAQAETNSTATGFLFTATGAIPVSIHCFTDVVDGNGFTSINVVDIAGSASAGGAGTVAITSNVKKNQALAGFTFVMFDATTNAPKTGLTVTAQRSLDGAALGACANAVSEVSNGIYTINLAAADLNGNTVMLRFSAVGANDTDIEIITQP